MVNPKNSFCVPRAVLSAIAGLVVFIGFLCPWVALTPAGGTHTVTTTVSQDGATVSTKVSTKSHGSDGKTDFLAQSGFQVASGRWDGRSFSYQKDPVDLSADDRERAPLRPLPILWLVPVAVVAVFLQLSGLRTRPQPLQRQAWVALVGGVAVAAVGGLCVWRQFGLSGALVSQSWPGYPNWEGALLTARTQLTPRLLWGFWLTFSASTVLAVMGIVGLVRRGPQDLTP